MAASTPPIVDTPILLVRPPEQYLPHRPRPMAYLPLGLMQIAAALERDGYSARIVDGIQPDEIRKGGENFFGVTMADMRRKIEESASDIVGISAQFTFQWPNALATARLCKEINPDCTVVLGGAHASVAFEEILEQHRCVDVVVRGEGELVFSKVVAAIRQKGSLEGIAGVAIRGDGGVASWPVEFIADLDALPFPAYHLVDMDRFFELMKRFGTRKGHQFPGCERGITMITSRGCPFKCVFCSIHLHMGKKWRAHSAEYVLRHLEFVVEEYGARYIHFEDDNLSFRANRLGQILDGIVKRGLRIRWDTPNGVRADTFDVSLMEKCKQSGCTHLKFGIESGVQRVLDRVIEKSVELTRIEETLEMARRVGVDTRAFFMVGLPGETREEILATHRYAARIRWKYECFGATGMAVPLLGTRLYTICEDEGHFAREPSIEHLTDSYQREGIIRTDEFDPEFLRTSLEEAQRRTRRLKYVLLLRKLILHPWLAWYIVKKAFIERNQRLSKVCDAVIQFHHAIEYDRKEAKLA